MLCALFVLAWSSSMTLHAQNKNLTFLGKRTYSNDLSDVWGYAAQGREYALVGVFNGVSIVDVTNSAQPAELFFVPGPTTTWRDIATSGSYAYVTNEGGSGLLIINLSYLPDSIQTSWWTGGSLMLNSAHTIFSDENGILYVAGANQAAGRGVIMLDPRSNPFSPVLLGKYNLRYVHDVFVRGDTLWSCEINDGIFSVVQVQNKNNPIVLATSSTPGNVTHNAWLSANGKYLLTTDEISNGVIAAYDVSDLNNIRLLDMFRSNPGSFSIPHNVHYVGDFAVASYYRDGVVIIDASDPANLIQVGNYDTSPLSGNGFNGVWSVYPYLPSGNILASDIEEGLFILAPTYRKACYLEGVVTDVSTNQPIPNVTVSILSSGTVEQTSLLGAYKTGIADSGTYSVQFAKTGYQTLIQHNVMLQNGQVTTLNVQLMPAVSIMLNGSVVDVTNGQGIPYARILFKSLTNTYQAVADPNGNFGIQNFETGTYDVYAGSWGYLTRMMQMTVLPNNPVVAGLQKGYYDDFLFDYGWTTSATAASGLWELAVPIGTMFNLQEANPSHDVATDWGEMCYVTGNGGGQAGNDDVDDGVVVLISPTFNLSSYHDPFVTYYRWFFNSGGNTPVNDTLFVKITNGADTTLLEYVTAQPAANQWNYREFRVKDFITPTADMRLIFETADASSSGHIVEAAVDVFSVKDSSVLPLPAAEFIATTTTGCPGDTFHFMDLSQHAPTAWFWEFPGGQPPVSSDSSPQVVYFNPGLYSVTLSVSNATGTSSIVKQNYILIYQPPAIIPAVTPESFSGAANGSIQLNISGSGSAFTVQWGDGASSMLREHLRAGLYSVTVSDEHGCSSIDTIQVGVGTTAAFIQPQVMQAYPNPFAGNITLHIADAVSDVTIFNVSGHIIQHMRPVPGVVLQWGDSHPPGIYFMVARTEQTTHVIRLVKLW
ncbi:MAG: hypothetical protein KatS3mg031_1910 [Chitinophagales bacterium]|nr:MAG: hypothetical protein KatS3mg031_1910 [Chitinophagales bacterium]